MSAGGNQPNVDFAKEARDTLRHLNLPDTAVTRGWLAGMYGRMHDAGKTAGVAEGLATAAEIARAAAKVAAEKHNAAPNSIAREEYAGAWKQALDIAEAILAAAPPPRKDE